MSKKDFDRDLFWRELRIYYDRMKKLSSMSEYYEGVCWGLSAGALNSDIISNNTFKIICRLLQVNCRKDLKYI